jgi:hypothetical protein
VDRKQLSQQRRNWRASWVLSVASGSVEMHTVQQLIPKYKRNSQRDIDVDTRHVHFLKNILRSGICLYSWQVKEGVRSTSLCLQSKEVVTHAKQLTTCSRNTSSILKALCRSFSSVCFWKYIKQPLIHCPFYTIFMVMQFWSCDLWTWRDCAICFKVFAGKCA